MGAAAQQKRLWAAEERRAQELAALTIQSAVKSAAPSPSPGTEMIEAEARAGADVEVVDEAIDKRSGCWQRWSACGTQQRQPKWRALRGVLPHPSIDALLLQ